MAALSLYWSKGDRGGEGGMGNGRGEEEEEEGGGGGVGEGHLISKDTLSV